MTTDAATKPCPFCAEPILVGAVKCRHCAEFVDGRRAPQDGGAVQTIIPTSNPAALMAYYCAVFGIIPGFGIVLAPLALVLGLVGRSKVKRDPRLAGTAHAWAGIIGGGIVTLVYVAIFVAIVTHR